MLEYRRVKALRLHVEALHSSRVPSPLIESFAGRKLLVRGDYLY
jgi:hypothetical protein